MLESGFLHKQGVALGDGDNDDRMELMETTLEIVKSKSLPNGGFPCHREPACLSLSISSKGEKFFLIVYQNLLPCHLNPLFLILSSGTTG